MREPDEISGTESTIDSRDLLARCEHLESVYDDLKQAVEDAKEELAEAETKKTKAAAQEKLEAAEAELNAWDGGVYLELDDPRMPSGEYDEMLALREAVDELGEQSCRYGDASLISEDYFTEYAQELAEDCCEVPRDLKWPFTCIDWDEAADVLKADYSTITLFGNDYYYRNC